MVRADGVLQSVEYLAIGHVTLDVLPDACLVVGGTVSYAARTAAALCRSVGILTSASADFDFSVFDGIAALNARPARGTTTFRNLYLNGRREQFVYTVAQTLDFAMVPAEWQRPEIVHIGPVIGECNFDLVESFHEPTFIGLTPQGWMRSRDGDSRVYPHHWEITDDLLRRASAVVFSIDDIQGDWEAARRFAQAAHLLVVTMDQRGGVLFVDGEPMPFAALSVPEVDPTGAGDIFAAAFFSEVAAGVDPRRAVEFAACVASRSVMRVGIEGTPTPDDIASCRSVWVQSPD